MFGSEYSELLKRRRFTSDEIVDFPLRRTVDNCLEIVEIKRPLSRSIFRYDADREVYHPGPELSSAIGQVANYISLIELERLPIEKRYKVDTSKVGAKIIIGRDGDDDERQTLRNLNSHLHRIEILTYDQLIRIAEQVINILRGESNSTDYDDVGDIPF